MKVILKAKIDKLGDEGEIKEVKSGYARNFLIPKKLVMEATSVNLKILKEEKVKLNSKKEKEKKQALLLAEKITSHSYTISKKVGEEDKLYGAVTTKEIADCIKAEFADIDKKNIEIKEPIKKLGVYQISVKIYPGVAANIKLWIVKE